MTTVLCLIVKPRAKVEHIFCAEAAEARDNTPRASHLCLPRVSCLSANSRRTQQSDVNILMEHFRQMFSATSTRVDFAPCRNSGSSLANVQKRFVSGSCCANSERSTRLLAPRCLIDRKKFCLSSRAEKNTCSHFFADKCLTRSDSEAQL